MKKITLCFPEGEIDGKFSVMKVEVEGYPFDSERMASIMTDFTSAYGSFLVGTSNNNPDIAEIALYNIVVPQIKGIIEAARLGDVDMLPGSNNEGECPRTDFAGGKISAEEINARLGKAKPTLQDRVVAEALRKAKDIKGGSDA